MFISLFLVVCWLTELANGCSCMWNHPQTDICQPNSFVVLARVQDYQLVRLVKNQAETGAYKKQGNKSKRDNLAIVTRMDKRNNLVIEDNEYKFEDESKWTDVVVNKTEMQEAHYEWNYRLRYRIKVYRAYKGISDHTNRKNCKDCKKLFKSHQKTYIYSAVDEGLCGARLRPKQTYLLIGDIFEGRLTINLCNHVIRWSRLTPDDKRAIRKNMNEVTLSCNVGCEVVSCHHSGCKPQNSKQCTWSRSMHQMIGNSEPAGLICTPKSKGRCVWNGPALKKIPTHMRRRRHQKMKRNSIKQRRSRDTFPAP